MANLDTNFLARPDFFVSTGENGKTITLTTVPKIIHEGDETQSTPLDYYAVGIGAIPVNMLNTLETVYTFLFEAWGNNPEYAYGVANVSPTVSDNYNFFQSNTVPQQILGVINFFDFVSKNPVHIKGINIRATDENMLPQQIIIKTPNVFTGQCDTQIIDISSKKTAYQYQNGIITILDTDLYLCRNSEIDFNASFKVSLPNLSEGEMAYILNQTKPVFIDLIIDKYLSLEKALIENLKLM